MFVKRCYSKTLRAHFKDNRQMAFVVGPRQVGKTTLCSEFIKSDNYFNWDNINHRALILEGPAALADKLPLNVLTKKQHFIIFDEIHKYKHWKTFIKGFFDVYSEKVKIIVTGSARLDVFRKGGDSLMGRYFLHRVHPFSIREISGKSINTNSEINNPVKISDDKFENLIKYGGFPEPYIKSNIRFYNRWKNLRDNQLIKEDIRDLSLVKEIDQLELFAQLLKLQSGQLMNYTSLANKVRVSVDTIRRWVSLLENQYYCFLIRPWTKNISRSLIKEPKCFLWDWSLVEDKGLRLENFVASHLLKAIQFYQDIGLGKYSLHFIRNKDKKEVDFLVAQNDIPWFIVEVKTSANKQLSKNLVHFKNSLNLKHAFQVVFDLDFVDLDCFAEKEPIIVPAKTFLSQLI